jgi:signal transduction histidine kinase
VAESRAKRILLLGAVTTVYFLAGRFGLSLAFINESASAVWPPSGIAVAALLLLGVSAWPAVTLGSFLVNLTTSGVALVSAAMAVGNTVEAVFAVSLTMRFARGRAAFDRAVDIVRFALFAAMGATAIAATVGTASLVLSGLAPPADAGSIWLTWWLGDSAGVLLVTPLVLLWRRPARAEWTLPVVLEAVALVACLATASLLVFGGASIAAGGYPLEFVVVPFLLWAAFRFGARETALSSAIVSVIAINGTLNGYGPFARSSPNQSLLLLQAFVGMTATVMLAVAAEVSRRRAVEGDIRSLNDTLEKVIAREQAARREAEQANQVKERFLATLSHELRTPLNAALGWARMLIDVPYSDDRFDRGLRAIHRNLVIQARLVADIIDVSRGVNSGLDVERNAVDVTSIVHAAVDTVRESGTARGITVRMRSPEGATMIVGDSGRLQQVVWNLLENAIKFSGDGSSVEVSVMHAGDAIEVAVADSGPGVDPAFLPYVFDEFRQADESLTRTHGGLGLGLAIARRIVQQHGGTIVAANRPEGGALFTVRLPVETTRV